MLKRILYLLVFTLVTGTFLSAQVTTSGMAGVITGATNEAVVGATLTARHEPTGTIYRTASRTDGRYNIANMTPGGPYTITVTYVGLNTETRSDVYLTLGEAMKLDFALQTQATELTGVVVTSVSRDNVLNKRRAGTGTNITREQIQTLPTLNRSLQDFTRLTPQATGSNSFGGMNNRFNNITIDGAVNNDVFGLSGSGTPGGQASTTPISLDAIQEIQVVLAPYDVSYGNFTGGGINAVTRSGTNKFEGSLYSFFRNQNTIGTNPSTKVRADKFHDNQYGFRFGGPIIKNKLFFFVNAEIARRSQPTLFNLGEPGAAITATDAQRIADTLRTRYGYNVGSTGVFDQATESNKVFGRIDWNITDKHRVLIRHNYINAFDDKLTRSATRFDFGNNGYRFNNDQNISVVELRSRFSNRLSNNLLIGYSRIRDSRNINGSPFPFIEIFNGPATIQAGSERSSVANELDQDILELTNNFKVFAGRHTITLGTHNEYFKFRNLFINNYNGRWTYNNLNNFYNNSPNRLRATYSIVPGEELPAARFDAFQLGFYGQDEIDVTRRLRITAGLRVDVPIIPDTPPENPKFSTTFPGKTTASTPSGQLLWAPRVGFNYDVTGDRSLQLRGGAGIFTGRVPFVWMSNQFSNSGMLYGTIDVTNNNINSGRGFNPNISEQRNLGTAGRTFEVNASDENFRIPQVFRTNLAVDTRLPGDIVATVEGIFTKTLNNVLYQDINLKPANMVVDPGFNNGADQRPMFDTTSGGNGRRINRDITNALFLSNTQKGFAYSFTVNFTRNVRNLYTSLGYTNNLAMDINSGASSTALSNYEFVQIVSDPNNPPLAVSNYSLRHRIISALGYNINWAKNFRTTVSLFYEGRSGTPYTYVLNGDLNGDGNFGNDLIYVPRNQNEIRFLDRLSGTTVVATAAQQAAAFEEFIQKDKYLSSRRGMYTERNGAEMPWEHVIDMRLLQDIVFKTGDRSHTLQLSFDIFNLTNLLNRDWGRQNNISNQAYSLLSVVRRGTQRGYNFTPVDQVWNQSFGSRWQGQFGVRYIF